MLCRDMQIRDNPVSAGTTSPAKFTKFLSQLRKVTLHLILIFLNFSVEEESLQEILKFAGSKCRDMQMVVTLWSRSDLARDRVSFVTLRRETLAEWNTIHYSCCFKLL